MKTIPRPGTLVWCAECGDIKQLEVVPESYARCSCKRFQGDVCVRYPHDDVMVPWHCNIEFMFESKEDAVKLAIEQLTRMIDSNNFEIKDLRRKNKELKQQIQQYEETINGLAKT